jgi:PAS domain S-box-containing protein
MPDQRAHRGQAGPTSRFVPQPIGELAAIVASTDDAIVGTREGIISSWNRGAERLYGYRADEVIGRPITVLLPPEWPAGPTDLLERLRRGERLEHFESVRMRKDGARIDVSLSVAPIHDEGGRVVGIATIARDVSAQKRAEALLREREEQYRGVFAATTDGLSITDLDSGALIDVNPAFCAMHGRERDEMLGMHPTDFIHPDDHHLFREFLETVRAGGQFRTRARDFRRDGSVFPVEVLGTPFQHGGRLSVLAVVRDVTEQVEAMRLLEDRVQERTRELSTLLGVARHVASTLELEPLMEVILDQLRTVVDYDAAAILVPRGDALVPIGHRVPVPFADSPAIVYPLARAEVGALWDSLRRGESVVVDDLHGPSGEARALRTVVGGPARDQLPFAAAWLGVPLVARERTIGVLSIWSARVGYFTPRHLELAGAVAAHAAAAMENARLFERSERRSRELGTLLEVSRNMVGTLALKPLLGVVLDQLRTVIDYGSAAVLTLEGEDLVVQDYRGPRPREEVVDVRIALAGAIVFREVLQGRTPVIIPDVLDDSELSRLFRQRGERAQQAFPSPRSWLGVPLVAKDRMIGMLRLDHPEPRRFAEADAALALVVANQAAVAIENARLYEQAHERAATDERQRLARELHDAVTQTLFSASLIADVLPRVLARDPDQALARLEEVRQLTRGALAEMRTLLLELRPAALTEADLGELIRHLTDAFVGRTRVPLTLTVEGQAVVPPDVQVALYRVAQEALNNAAKYSGATRVEVRLRLEPDLVALSVQDNGHGFDPAAVGPGHLGLGIMRERCAQIGAEFALESRVREGTMVSVRWPESAGRGTRVR